MKRKFPVAVILLLASCGDPGPSTPTPTPLLALTYAAPAPGLVECPTTHPAPPANSPGGDRTDHVHFDGVTYEGGKWAPQPESPDYFSNPDYEFVNVSQLGSEYGRTAYTLGLGFPLDYELLNCDASYLAVGTGLYTIEGEDPRQRLALSDGRVYIALPE